MECDPKRAKRGALHSHVEIECARIQASALACSGRYQVALLMPGRLLEMSTREADRVRSWLPGLAKRLVVYSYNGELTKLVNDAGLRLVSPINVEGSTEVAEAEVISE